MDSYCWRSRLAKNGMDLEPQNGKKIRIRMLDLFQSLHLNAVIFQIRPVADAFYHSKYEPWSFYLPGIDKGPGTLFRSPGFCYDT
ncbi:MAG: hypothetical protein U5K51_09190 [Flavobacteriaceae bacterium]|nr:hypothetical protein [Flavobacteriaceae bacterium]